LKSDPYGRERSLAVTIAVLAGVLAIATEGYFSRANLTDLFLANLPVLIVALGATMVIVSGEIDISVGSVFAICSVVAGVAAKTGLPMPLVAFVIALVGGVLGAINGSLVAYLRIPSIVVTLATMIGLRDALRWATQGAWVQDLPANFQWLGLSQSAYPIVMSITVVLLVCAIAWGGRHLAAGRAIYATGSNAVAARLAGLDTALVKWSVFTLAGALTGLSAVLNAARFNQIPSNAGIGLEMRVIAAAVVGGAAITGGRATFAGTVLGVVLLGAIGPALTFLGVSAYWERAIQGAIVLAAVAAR
jgi:rhamnose transport system permease protein